VTSGDGGWSDWQKWAAGVAATVIGALLIWGATREGGWFNPTPPPPAPVARVSIVEFDAPFPLTNDENHIATFTIANEGNAVARGCIITGHTSPALGQEFSVQPGTSTTVEWGIRTFGLEVPGSYDFTAQVRCQNATSAEETRTLSIAF
jgi:hypothetical protein